MESAMQRALIQYRNPKNYDLVKEALLKAGRSDLIGFGPQCLIRPQHQSASFQEKQNFSHKKPYTSGSSARNTKPAKKKSIRNVHKKKSS